MVVMQLEPQILNKLKPHQIEPVGRLVEILNRYQSAVDLSDMGTGKTYVAAAVAVTLKLPTLVITPKVAVTAWHRAAEHFNDSFSVLGYEKLRTGRTKFGWWDNPLPVDTSELDFFKCQCCQLRVNWENLDERSRNYMPCYCHHLGIHCLETHRKSWDYGKFNFHPAVKLVIADECQRCSGMDSLNADMMLATKRQNIKMLGLSATPASSPLGFRALGYNLDLHNDRTDQLGPVRKPNFFRWAAQYGCRKDARFHGFKWMAGKAKQLGIMSEIRASIVPFRGVRVAIADIPDFPKCHVSAELYDLEGSGEIDRLYAEMAESLAIHDQRAALDHECVLTAILRARQKIELLKVPIAVELANDYLEKGCSVGIFINFRQTMDELRRRLKTDCIIDGSPEGIRGRQSNIDSFNENHDRLILINTEAGGAALSLPDLDGNHPRVGLVFPGFSAMMFKQLLGRFPRESSKSASFYRVLFAAGTIETKMHRALSCKLDNLDALLDGDLMPENLRLTKVW